MPSTVMSAVVTHQVLEYSVRSYQPPDKESVREICCDSGFLGNPIDPIFCDREMFAALFVDPYLDYAGDWAFVAELDGRIIGYLTGAVEARFLRQQTFGCLRATQIVVARALRGCYRAHGRSRHFVRWLLTRAGLDRVHRPPYAPHMHFNVVKDYRGHTVGRTLWEAFEEKLIATGHNRYFGEVITSKPLLVERVYKRFNLSVYDKRRTSVFEPESPEVWSICFFKDGSFLF
ncbi:MAG TPA: hypothetical protein VF286_06380 [Acidiphilium sp.]